MLVRYARVNKKIKPPKCSWLCLLSSPGSLKRGFCTMKKWPTRKCQRSAQSSSGAEPTYQQLSPAPTEQLRAAEQTPAVIRVRGGGWSYLSNALPSFKQQCLNTHAKMLHAKFWQKRTVDWGVKVGFSHDYQKLLKKTAGSDVLFSSSRSQDWNDGLACSCWPRRTDGRLGACGRMVLLANNAVKNWDCFERERKEERRKILD